VVTRTQDQEHVSITDVARLAGVSASTVSRSLRGNPHVSAETRARVLQVAAELAYVPSPAASRLASGRTGTVGVIVPFSTRWFFSEVVIGAERALREAGYDLLLYNIGETESRAQFFATMPLARRVDAVLVVAASLEEPERAALDALGVPVSVVGGRQRGHPGVGIDDEAGAATAVRHLILLGHTDIAMVSGDPDDPIGRATTVARRAGFQRALSEAGLPVGRISSAPWGVTGGMQAIEEMLTWRRLPTAVFAESDEMALGALQMLRRAGLAVPGRLSLIGFDDHEMAPVGDLTTIAQPVHAQGDRAARILLGALAEPVKVSAEDVYVLLPTRLIVRGTTAPPPAAPGPSE
jgi:LacI family repressor for deo operon, udp, cdd, tsx, nupC, and nupG